MFSWGEAGTLGIGEVRFVGAGWGKVSRGTLRLGRLGMVIKVRCGVVDYDLKFLPLTIA